MVRRARGRASSALCVDSLPLAEYLWHHIVREPLTKFFITLRDRFMYIHIRTFTRLCVAQGKIMFSASRK